MCRKISASVDGGPSGGSRVHRPGSEDPHRRERNSVMVSLAASTQIGRTSAIKPYLTLPPQVITAVNPVAAKNRFWPS